jgi:hypothetical protein
MNVAMPKIRRGVALAKEIVQAADVANNQDGRITRAELRSILDAEGYEPGHPMRRGTMSLFNAARELAGGKAPTAKDVAQAAAQSRQAIRDAAGQDGQPGHLSRSEFETLSPADKRAARFAARYGDDTLDEYFF